MTYKYDWRLTTWASVIHAQGDTDSSGGADYSGKMPHAEGAHSDPTLAETIRCMSDHDRRTAAIVDRFIRKYPLQIKRALRELYVGRQSGIVIAHTVHGDVLRIRYDGPVSLDEAAHRLQQPVASVRRWVKSGERDIKRDVNLTWLAKAGRIGFDGILRAA